MPDGILTAFGKVVRAVLRPALAAFAASVVLAGAAEARADVAAAASDSENGWLLTALNVAAVVCFVLWWRWMDRKPVSPAPSASLALEIGRASCRGRVEVSIVAVSITHV